MNAFQTRPFRAALRSTLVVATVLALGLTTLGSAGATVRTDVAAAKAALARATTRAGAGEVAGTLSALGVVRIHTRRANAGAKALIGKPPTDPESDDPPGPPAVTAALRLDAAVVRALAPIYAGKPARMVTAFNATIGVTQASRLPLLQKVAGLPPEGAGADYADGMADMLGLFKREVTVLKAAVQAAPVAGSAHTGLTNALARAIKANAIVTRAFGGGERPAA
jgi:hypothetical protein